MRRLLGIENNSVVSCLETRNLLSFLQRDFCNGKTVLVRSQWTDLPLTKGLDTIRLLAKKLPRSQHVAVVLECELEEVSRRVRARGIASWASGYTVKNATEHAERIIANIQPLKEAGITVLRVDSTTSEYREKVQ